VEMIPIVGCGRFSVSHLSETKSFVWFMFKWLSGSLCLFLATKGSPIGLSLEH
jgi:hypothetical protein